MLFTSFSFAVFLPVVFAIYWLLKDKVKWQNVFLLAASYFFYCWWDWRYLSLVLLCSITNYSAGIRMMKTGSEKYRKIVLTLACVVSLGVLGLFKYYNFFVNSLVDAFAGIGVHLQIHTLRLILPVGISFYTFHTLSYTIDVYKRKFEPTKDVISFFLFVSIFPLAMAGPIERATNLLPQIYRKRVFDYNLAVDGMRQILWGLFKKVVIADNCAIYVNQVFDSYDTCTGSTLLTGAILFAFQIYCDFSGYSDMALGIGKLMGFKFLQNFNFPYFSRDIAEFWRRWHISLTTWFRDYIYIPLGGSRVSKVKIVRNTFIIFLISGFWHGANWTFICWGAYHAVLFLPLILLGANRKNLNVVAAGKRFPSIRELFQMGLTFGLVVLGWILFRAENMTQAWIYIKGVFSSSLFTMPHHELADISLKYIGGLLLLFMMIEWQGRDGKYAIEKLMIARKPFLRYTFYLVLAILVLCYSLKDEVKEFIYFQF